MALGVLFDVDGTLVTFQFDVRGTRKAILDRMVTRGFDTRGLDLTTPTQRFLDAARSQSLAGSAAKFEAFRKEVFDFLDASETQSVPSTSPLPGVGAALDGLLSRGARLGVLTNSGRTAAEGSLRKAGLLPKFEFVLTRDDTETMKPRPEGLIMAASRFGLPRESVCYVGDGALDIEAGKAAGMRVVSVATGNLTAGRLRAAGAGVVISGLGELGGVLGL